MTLNLTLLTAEAIYQSADFQLTDGDIGEPLQTDSMKLVTVHYPGWEGFVSYTGVGRWRERDTADLIVEWLTGLHGASPQDVIERIRERGTEFLGAIERARRGRRFRHTFVFAAFVDGVPLVAVISNFEDCSGRSDDYPSPELRVDTRRMAKRPALLVTGRKAAVARASRRRLERVAERTETSPARIRNELSEINAEAAESPKAAGTVSSACSVVSFRRDGSGFQDLTGGSSAQPRSLLYGEPVPDIAAVVGVNAGRVRGLSFVRSSPETRQHPYPPCVPRLVSPEDRGDYELVELTHRELDSTVALDVNEQGTVLGSGTRPGQPGVHVMSLWERNGSGELLSFTGSAGPRGLSQRGEICATADMTDGSVHATRWFPGQPPEDLGTIHGTESDEFADSGASAINNLGGVAGWVSLSSDPQDRGLGNYRPAVWIPADGPIFLTDFAFAWGQGIDINDDGTVLVVAYTEGIMGKTKALLWNPVEGRLDPVGGDEPDGVYPMGLTSDGIILGNAAGRSGERIACVSTDSGPWARLGTPEGWYATTMDNSRSVTGSVNIGGFERPWLRRPNGDVLWLPYFDHHYCRPNSMTDTGLVAGTAQTDHGTHALFWRSENS